jgi:hypothetical protein
MFAPRRTARPGRALFPLLLSPLLAFAALLPAQPAGALQVIDFESLLHGAKVADQFLASDGLRIIPDNPNRNVDVAAAFDSGRTPTSDADLEGPPSGPWAGGNLAPNTDLGILLILTDKRLDANHDGLIDSPSDEGFRPAGSLTFLWNTTFEALGFDLVDVEGPLEFGSVELRLGGVSVATISFGAFIDPASPVYDPSIAYGNNTANRVRFFATSDVGAPTFDRVVFHLGGSTAVDRIVVGAASEVPEPRTLLLLGAGTAALAAWRRMRPPRPVHA